MLIILIEGQGSCKGTREAGGSTKAQGGYEADHAQGEASAQIEEAREARLRRRELRPRRGLDGGRLTPVEHPALEQEAEEGALGQEECCEQAAARGRQ